MAANRPKRPFDEKKNWTPLEEKELEKVVRKVATQKIFADTFKAAFHYAAKDAWAKALTFEEAFELAYKEALKEAFEVYYL